MSDPLPTDKESLSEIAKMRDELDRLREFKRKVDEWMFPTSYIKLFLREFDAAKTPTSDFEACARSGLTAVVYRCVELCASSVVKEEAEKIRKMLPVLPR